MDERDIEQTYDRAGFGARVRRGSRPAVVVVDLTRGFTEPQWPTGTDLTEVVKATGSLLEIAAGTSVPVIFTVISYGAEEANPGAHRWLEKASGMASLIDGSEVVAIDPRLPRQQDDVVVVKKGASAFFGSALATVLHTKGVDTVIVCGATTSGCVRATVVDAVQHGFGVLVPRECVGDRAQEPHDANLFDIDAKYGDVISVEDARGYLRDTVTASTRSEAVR